MKRSDIWDKEEGKPEKEEIKEVISECMKDGYLKTGDIEIIADVSKRDALKIMRVLDRYHDDLKLKERSKRGYVLKNTA